MTTPDEQPENSPSEPVEPQVESISIGRGSFSALNGGEDVLKQFDKFLDPERGSMPDIDGNFVSGDKVRARAKEKLREKYGVGVSGEEPSKLIFERFLDPERASLPQPGEWFTEEQYREYKKFMESNDDKTKPAPPDSEHSVLDGYSDKEEVIRKAREAEDTVSIRSAQWFNSAIGTNHFFR